MNVPDRKFCFLDRDGTINEEVHFLSHPDQLRLIPNTAAALQLLRSLGYTLVVLTNQSGIGHGYFDDAAVAAVHRKLDEILAELGAKIDAYYYCPHLTEARCVCRKPQTGMVEAAVKDLGISLSGAVMIGDRWSDLQLGHNIGATKILVRTGYGAEQMHKLDLPAADYCAENLWEAARWLESDGRI